MITSYITDYPMVATIMYSIILIFSIEELHNQLHGKKEDQDWFYSIISLAFLYECATKLNDIHILGGYNGI